MKLDRRMIVLFRLTFLVAISLSLAGCSMSMRSLLSGSNGAEDAACCATLASGMGQNLQVHTTDHFLLLTSADGATAAQTGRFLDQVYRRFYESFAQAGFDPQPLSGKLVCLCFNSYSQLNAYGRAADGVEASWMDGYYSYNTNRVVFVRSGGSAQRQAQGPEAFSSGAAATYRIAAAASSEGTGLNPRTVTHELAHQLAFNSGLQNRDVTYPFWLTEGLATNFEADAAGCFGLEAKGACCHRCLLMAAKSRGKLMPLDQFAAMTELSNTRGQGVHDTYAQAWGLFHYLFQYHRRELKDYMAGGWPANQSRESQLGRFVKAFGPIEPLEKGFLRFIDDSAR